MNFDGLILALANTEAGAQVASHAAKAAETATEAAHPANMADVILHSNLLNFALVAVFLVWIIRKTHALSGISAKREAIIANINASEEDKTKSANMLELTQKRLKNSASELKEIVQDAEEVGASLSARIVSDADNEAKNMEQKADKTIQTERSIASNEVMKDISNAAFVIAEKHIRNAVDDRLHNKYIDEFIDSLDNIKV